MDNGQGIQQAETAERNVFTNKNFFLLFLGALVSNLGSTFYNFATGFYILKITNDNAFIQGVYLAVAGVVFVVTSFFGGVLADRWNKAKIIWATDCIRGALVIAGGVVLYLSYGNGGVQLTTLFVLAVLFNILAAVFSPASSAIVQGIVSKTQYQQASSYMIAMNSFLGIAGQILGALCYTVMPMHLLLILVGALYVASGISEMFITCRHTPSTSPLTLKGMFGDIGKSFVCLKSKKALATVIIATLFANFFIIPFSQTINYFINVYVAPVDYLFGSFMPAEYWVSIVSSAIGIGSIVIALIIGGQKQKSRLYPTMMTGWALASASMAIPAVSFFLFVSAKGAFNSINAYLVILTFAGLALGSALTFFNVPVSTYIYKVIEPEMLAKVSSLMSVGSMGLTPLASLLAGSMVMGFGYGCIPVFSACGFIVITLILAFNSNVRKA